MIIQPSTGQIIFSSTLIILSIGAIQWLLSMLIKSRLEKSIEHEYNKKLEEYKLVLQKEYSKFTNELILENKIKEQAEKVAEYLAFARNLKEDSSDEDYVKANKLSWDLALWLPEEIYKEITIALSNPNFKTNPLSVVISVRKLILKDRAGNLNSENIAHHAPGIGRK